MSAAVATDCERRQKFVDDLVAAVKSAGTAANDEDGDKAKGGDCGEGDTAAEVSQYVLLRVKLARSEARLKAQAGAANKEANGSKSHDQQQQEKKKRKSSSAGSYFSVRSMLGLDVMSAWWLLAFATLCVLIHGYRNDYFSLLDHVLESVNQRCLLSADDYVMEMSRAPVNCDMCRDMREMPVEYNMTKELFLQKYAYTARPVLIKSVVTDWKALQNFSLEFFKDLYDSKPESYTTQNDAGQFFAYKTEFTTLREALHMSAERQKQDWYFGWSNADDEIGQKLRQYYNKPRFIPADAESSRIDWMFMGISAKGAQLHIDYVARPSWQAQIKGRKIWEIVPSPECTSVCHSFNVTVHPGDIINIDTNRWYHATYVLPGDFSVTIGSEYD